MPKQKKESRNFEPTSVQPSKKNWIIPGNNSYFRIIDLFEDKTTVDWKKQKNANYNVGDTVYIYCAGKEKRILFKTKVIALNLNFDDSLEDDNYIVGPVESPDVRKHFSYFRLELEGKLNRDDDRLSLNILKELGLKGNIQGPMYVPTPKIQQRLDEVFNDTNEEQETPLDNNSIPDFSKFQPQQIIYYGAPGTGKSHTIKTMEDDGLRCIRTTFHPDTDYSSFVGCYKPHRNHQTKELTYEFVEQAFLEAYKLAWQNPQQELALVIEEINRGNCAQIFGDIFQLLDRDEDGWSTFPIKADTDICEYLENLDIASYSETMAKRYGLDKAGFDFMALPPNLSILATMNTSDQSLFPIDSAFKRRWDWQYTPISKGRDKYGHELNWKICTTTRYYDWWSFLSTINAHIISTTNSEDKQLGFFFCKAADGRISSETFVGKVIFYLWNDVFKDYEISETPFKTEEFRFKNFYDVDNTGKVIVKYEKVELFLDSLELKFTSYKSDENSIINPHEASNYALNGQPIPYLYEIVYKIVENYANTNINLSAQEIRDYFVNQCKGIGIAHIVETETEYHTRDSQPSQERTSKELTIPNGEKIYISTQWRSKSPNDNFILFISKAAENGWGTISPVE